MVIIGMGSTIEGGPQPESLQAWVLDKKKHVNSMMAPTHAYNLWFCMHRMTRGHWYRGIGYRGVGLRLQLNMESPLIEFARWIVN